MAAWLGEPLPGGGLGPLSLQSRIVSYGKVTAFAPMRLVLDGQTVTGTLTLDRTSGIALDGALDVDRLDLNPYLASKGTVRKARKTTTGWSTDPIDLGVFQKLDVRLTIITGSLRLRGLHLGRTVLRLEAENGRVTARLDPVSFYGGSGMLQLEAGERGQALDFRVGANIRNVALRPFLGDALGIDSIEGTGALDLDISGRGRSADAIMHSLSGKGSIAAAPGRFRGADLGRVAHSISTLLGGDATGRFAATDFHSMGGSFVIAQGVLHNDDFNLLGSVVQMRGAGNIDIGGRSIDFHLEPSAVIEGIDIGIPFRVRGSWDKLHYAPDYAEILGGVADNLRAGRAPFKGLLGGGDNKKPQKKKKNIGDKLKDILGIH
jgi:AsmA protein